MKIRFAHPALVLSAFTAALILLSIALTGAHTSLNFDEGYNLQVPRSLIQYGVYGSHTLAGFQSFDPNISSGPLYLIPVTLVFRIFGAGVLPARMVSLVFAGLLLLALFVLNDRLSGRTGALLALALVLAVQDSIFRLGTILGDGAGIAIVLVGLVAWDHFEQRNRTVYAVLAGVFWGLSVWAKPSMIMAVLLIGLALLLGSIVHPERGKMKGLGAAIGLAAGIGGTWFLVSHLGSSPSQSLFSGTGIGLIRQQFDPHLAVNISHNLPLVLTTGALGFLAAAALNLAYDWKEARGNHETSLTNMTLQCLSLGWIAWFVFFNAEGDYRHLFPAMIFGITPFAQALHLRYITIPVRIVQAFLAILLMIGGLPALRAAAQGIANLENSHTAMNRQKEFATVIAGLEPEARIMGWGWFRAWDIAFLSDRPFGDLQAEASVPPSGFTYLVITPTILRYPELYSPAASVLERCSDQAVFETGNYHLYRLKPDCDLR